MKPTAHIDWLSVTYGKKFRFEMLTDWLGQIAYIGRGLHGYGSMYRSPNGAILLTDGTDTQGVHVILSGDALHAMRADGITDRTVCEFVKSFDGKTSRVDVAVNVFDTSLTVDDIAKAYTDGEITTPAKDASRTKNLKGPGDTLYIGSRSSERFFRAYNKAAEQNIKDGAAWLRLELELKKLKARAMTDALATDENSPGLISTAVQDFLAGTTSLINLCWARLQATLIRSGAALQTC